MVDIKTVFSPAQVFDNFGQLVSVFLKNATMLAAIIFFILLVMGGFGIIAGAGGDAKKLEQGKQAMTAAVIGFVVIVTAIWIVDIIGKITGLPLLSPGI